MTLKKEEVNKAVTITHAAIAEEIADSVKVEIANELSPLENQLKEMQKILSQVQPQ
ncbi:hypothetical protein ACFQI7_13855 [Paenibacillus allorhizosphaerae]|uniref:Uncharacterized protein n=1 Tax=Paenibacillus allorhizosphaerae TaxID=2849866 RepID=A0ABN7TR79_9BACL|nr:hypothetical protein [Paenibacillus allorhizosphaerae]CAG7652475.1 hypothetical protein PAECIP111802_05228 [Paenibacillus allorhizosphaerae]